MVAAVQLQSLGCLVISFWTHMWRVFAAALICVGFGVATLQMPAMLCLVAGKGDKGKGKVCAAVRLVGRVGAGQAGGAAGGLARGLPTLPTCLAYLPCLPALRVELSSVYSF